MNIKLRAALEMGKMLTVGMVIAGSMGLVIEVIKPSAAQIAYTLGFGALAYCFYSLYQITLSRLEYEAKLKETVDSFKK